MLEHRRVDNFGDLNPQRAAAFEHIIRSFGSFIPSPCGQIATWTGRERTQDINLGEELKVVPRFCRGRLP